MQIIPRKNYNLQVQATPNDVFEQISSSIQPMSTWVQRRYTRRFYGTAQFPVAKFRTSQNNDGWVWANAQVLPFEGGSSTMIKVSVGLSTPKSIVILLVLGLSLAGAITLLSHATSLKDFFGSLSPLLIFAFTWQSVRSDFISTCIGVESLLIKIEYQASIKAPNQSFNSDRSCTGSIHVSSS